MARPLEFEKGKQPSKLEIQADSVTEEWEKMLPDEPWSTIKSLMVTVVERYPDVIMLSNDKAREIIEKHEIAMPQGRSVGEITGRANPGITQLRMSINKIT